MLERMLAWIAMYHHASALGYVARPKLVDICHTDKTFTLTEHPLNLNFFFYLWRKYFYHFK